MKSVLFQQGFLFILFASNLWRNIAEKVICPSKYAVRTQLFVC